MQLNPNLVTSPGDSQVYVEMKGPVAQEKFNTLSNILTEKRLSRNFCARLLIVRAARVRLLTDAIIRKVRVFRSRWPDC